MTGSLPQRLLAVHNQRLEQHYGHNHLLLFKTRVLAGISSISSVLLLPVTLFFLTTGNSLMEETTRRIFVPFNVGLISALVVGYVALLKGYAALARWVVGVAVMVAIPMSVALTGGFPASVATPVLLLPSIIFFCLYGARAGVLSAILMPLFVLALYVLDKVFGIPMPNYTSQTSPDLNVIFVMLTTHGIAFLAIASYERSNRQLSERLDAELAKHAVLANLDSLTGLGNARFFDLELKRLLAQPRTAEQSLAVIYCDLDDFKPVNDNHGHAVGDEVLATVGKRLQSLTKQGTDTAARIGGDEFAIILQGCSSGDVPQVCARIRAAVTAPIMLNSGVFQVGISMGQAFAAAEDNDPVELIKRADRAMYQEKRRKPSDAHV